MDTIMEKGIITIEQFEDLVVERLQDDFNEDGNETVTVKATEVRKNNGVVLHGIIIRDDNSTLAPTVYVDGIYEQFIQGACLDECIDNIKEMYNVSRDYKVIVPPGIVDSFEAVEDIIFPKIINSERNNTLLEKSPHALIGDLAVIFQVYVSEFNGEGVGTVIVTDELCQRWNVQTDRLLSAALKNLNSKSGISIKSLYSIVSEMMLKTDDREVNEDMLQRKQSDDPYQMFVLSNQNKLNGAAGLLAEDKIAEFAERMDSDLYILPSSVNELIVLPHEESQEETEKLAEMVREVNRSSVPAHEFLSDNVYTFSRKDRSLRIALTGEKMQLKVA